MQIILKADIKKVTKQLTRIQKKAIPKATKRALNRTAAQVRTEAARAISKKTGMKVGQIKKHLIKINAQFNKLTAEVVAKKYSPNLVEYMTASQIKRAMARKGAGVRAKAWRTNKEYRGSFVGRGKNSGKTLVYARTGSSRNAKLKALYGPSVPRTFIEKEVMRALKRTARVRFQKNFEADLKYYISKL